MVIEIDDIRDERVAVFARLTEAQLRAGGLDCGGEGTPAPYGAAAPAGEGLVPRASSPRGAGVFVAESPKVIRVALGAGYEPLSLLCERRHISGDAADIIARCPEMPVYTGERELLEGLTGYRLTRGVLCAMRRPAERPAREVATGARRVCVIDDVSDTTNIGAIFRSAAALGVDAVLLSPTACDPLNRRAVRVSMGTVFLIPWARLSSRDYLDELRSLGFRSVAMALRNDSVTFDSPVLAAEPRLAIILGTEGEGLPRRIIDGADYVAKIPMARGVDSLNVAAASAVAFYQLCQHAAFS